MVVLGELASEVLLFKLMAACGRLLPRVPLSLNSTVYSPAWWVIAAMCVPLVIGVLTNSGHLACSGLSQSSSSRPLGL